MGEGFARTASLLGDGRLQTVCSESRCPNQHECWESGTATFLVLGTVCTRHCGFCSVSHGRPAEPDPDEPSRLARAAEGMGLKHVVITSVTRDDLPDRGAGHFAACIGRLRARLPGVTVEVLTPDFGGSEKSIRAVIGADPDVFAHNLETVERITPGIRSGASYRRSLAVLSAVRAMGAGILTKSGLMLGLGESDSEVEETLRDLKRTAVDMVTLGQYLRPAAGNMSVARYVPPEEFDRWRDKAMEIGFRHVAAAPFVRSSYRAMESMKESAGQACRLPAPASGRS